MNKRQRKKYVKKCASRPIPALIESTRQLLPHETLMSTMLVNDAWRKLQSYLRHWQELELERIERGPMPWIGARPTDASTEAEWRKANGTHDAAGKDS